MIPIKCFVKCGSVFNSNDKQYRSYDISIALYIDSNNTKYINFSIRFSDLINAEIALPISLKGLLPPKHVLSDYTLNIENVNKRVNKRINIYLNILFKEPCVRCNKKYHELLGITQNDSKIIYKTIKPFREKSYKHYNIQNQVNNSIMIRAPHPVVLLAVDQLIND